MGREKEGTGQHLAERFAQRLIDLGLGSEPIRLVVAVSGGCDSMVLLHLLRFHAHRHRLELTVAHLDHAMRPSSAGDVHWLRGLCTAWRIPLLHRRLRAAPRSEEQARLARYRFLHEVAARLEAPHVLTAHQADDQAETILFRILRGTGLHGLRGIPEHTAAGVLRPLLPFWRAEIEAYARANRLRWRSDETNRSLAPSRNLVRLRLLPEVERSFAPGARRALVALGAEAAEAELALERLVDEAERETASADGASILLARTALGRYDAATRTRLLRRLLRRCGTVLTRAGTRSALQFITDASSGREMSLGNGVVIRVEFDRVRLERREDEEGDRPLFIPRPEADKRWSGEARIGGAAYRVEARSGVPPKSQDREQRAWSVVLELAATRFPLLVRGWQPGDRVRTSGGTKTLKKLFLELRIPRSLRHRLPVVVDARGDVVWVAGLERPLATARERGGDILLLTIANV